MEQEIEPSDVPIAMPVIPEEVAILPLFDTVVFPATVLPIAVAQAASIRLVDEAVQHQQPVGVVALHSSRSRPATVGAADCHMVGTATIVHRLLRLPDGTLRIALEGVERIVVESFSASEPYLRAHVRVLADDDGTVDAVDAEQGQVVVRQVTELADLIPGFSAEMLSEIRAERDLRRLSYLVAGSTLQHLPLAERQGLLELGSTTARLQRIAALLESEIATRRGLRRQAPPPHPLPGKTADPPVGHESGVATDPDEALRHQYLAWAWRRGEPGVVAGLVAGGDTATVAIVEALAAPGLGSLELIGNPGPAIVESAALARAWLYSRVAAEPDGFAPLARGFALHLPQSARIPDDPAIGAALALALASALSGRPVRSGTVFCGRLTLRGALLPPDMLALRLHAARHVGATTIIVPTACQSIVAGLPATLYESLQILFVESLAEAVEAGLEAIALQRNYIHDSPPTAHSGCGGQRG